MTGNKVNEQYNIKELKLDILLQDQEAPIPIANINHLDFMISDAIEEAKNKGINSFIFFNHENGNSLGAMIGGDETVLSFNYSHQNPPYYASKGKFNGDSPVIVCYLLFEHYTEFPRTLAIPFDAGLNAIHEFYGSGDLPNCIHWVEV